MSELSSGAVTNDAPTEEGHKASLQRTLVGRVVSNKMNKT